MNKILLFLSVLFLTLNAHSQTFNFSLSGNPVNTTGWTMSSQSSVAADQINLTTNINDQVGYIYYSTPQNLANCSQFTVDFDFRIYNSSALTADGIAFFYITNPPTSFLAGSGIGLPDYPNGLTVIMDTYNNDNISNNPLLSIRRYDGTTQNYVEGTTTGQIVPDVPNLSFIADGNWHHCQISYSFGTISVSFDNNPPVAVGNTTLNLNGYFGFSASTGGSHAVHAIKNVNIQGAAEPDAPESDTTFYCLNEPTSPLTAVGNNLLWYNSAVGGTPSNVAPTPSSSVPGTYVWYVSSEVPGCNIESQRSPVVVVVNPLPAPPVIQVPVYCSGEPAAPFNISSGTAVQWYDDPITGVGTMTPPTVNTANVDTFTWYVTQTDLNGCESPRAPVTAIVHQKPKADFEYEIHYSCDGFDTVVFANNSQDATDYNWIFGNGSNSNATNPSQVYGPGDYQVVLTAYNENYCLDSKLKTIQIGHELKAHFTVTNDTICEGTLLNFSNNSTTQAIEGQNASFQWLIDGNPFSNNNNASYLFNTAGVYTIQLVASNSIPCFDTFSRIITVDSIVTIGFRMSDSIICQGDKVTVTIPQPESISGDYYWNFGETAHKVYNLATTSHSYEHPGEYEIILNAQYRACPDLDSKRKVKVKKAPQIYIGSDTSLCLNGPRYTFSDQINGNNPKASWLWNTGDTTSSIVITHPGTYTATVSIDGCSSSESIQVTKDCHLDIPNAFTPNNDGENDYFLPRQLLSEGLQQFKMTIFNRWGQKVFETQQLNGRGWDGSFNNQEQPMGVYIYQIHAEYKSGRTEEYTGNVTLIR